MNTSTIKRIPLVLLVSAFFAGPALDMALAAGSDTPSPPASSGDKSKDKKSDKKSSLDDPAFLKGYRTAYATIYENNDYAAAIPQLEALGQDDRADVANLIGYSYRKLGNYQLASV